MSNDIKINNIAIQSAMLDNRTKANEIEKTPDNDDVSVSTQLERSIKYHMAENTKEPNMQKIQELQQQIRNNQYQVKVDVLANKMAHSIINIFNK